MTTRGNKRHFIRLFPPKSRLKLYAFLLLTIVAVKLPVAWMFFITGDDLLRGDADDDLLARRRYLIKNISIEQSNPSMMPGHLSAQLKGEWAMITYSSLTSALTNMAFLRPETRGEALQQVQDLVSGMLTQEFQAFDTAAWGEKPLDSLDGPNGHIGYLGQLNWMIGAYRLLGGDGRFDSVHHRVNAAMIRRFENAPRLSVQTYPAQIFIPDNVVALASIRNYERIVGKQDSNIVNAWVDYARSNLLDPHTGLLAFRYAPDGTTLTESRGSGAAWNSFYLPFVDSRFASEQWNSMREALIQTRLFTGLREYRRGRFGLGDVDSGPVIFGFSPSGTGFALAGARHARDGRLITSMLCSLEAAGTTVDLGDGRHYLTVPVVGDAIVLAAKTAVVWDTRFLKAAPHN